MLLKPTPPKLVTSLLFSPNTYSPNLARLMYIDARMQSRRGFLVNLYMDGNICAYCCTCKCMDATLVVYIATLLY